MLFSSAITFFSSDPSRLGSASNQAVPQGVDFDEFQREVRFQLGQKTTFGFFLEGNVVRSVIPGSPADNVGLKKGDIMQAIDNFAPAAAPNQIGKYLGAVPDKAGASIFLTWRNVGGQIKRAQVERVDRSRFFHATELELKTADMQRASKVLLERAERLVDMSTHGSMDPQTTEDTLRQINLCLNRIFEDCHSMADNVVAILARQQTAEEEVCLVYVPRWRESEVGLVVERYGKTKPPEWQRGW